MPLKKAHPARLSDHQLTRLLDLTAQVLAQSQTRLRHVGRALIQANRGNVQLRKQLVEFRRASQP